MIRIKFAATSGISDRIVQIVRIGAGDRHMNIHRLDKTSYYKTIGMCSLAFVLVVVDSRINGGNYTLNIDETAAAAISF